MQNEIREPQSGGSSRVNQLKPGASAMQSKIYWRKKSALWVLSCGALMTLLAMLLASRISPWKLALLIPSGYNEQEYKGRSYGDGALPFADLTQDGRFLVVGRANAQAE